MLVKHVADSTLTQRYMVVEYGAAARSRLGFDASGHFVNHLPIHHLLHSFHWAVLDDKHVLVTGHFVPHHMKELENRHDVSVLSSLHSTAAMKSTMKKPEHWAALKQHHGLSENATLGDAIDSFVRKHGHVFSPPY